MEYFIVTRGLVWVYRSPFGCDCPPTENGTPQKGRWDQENVRGRSNPEEGGQPGERKRLDRLKMNMEGVRDYTEHC